MKKKQKEKLRADDFNESKTPLDGGQAALGKVGKPTYKTKNLHKDNSKKSEIKKSEIDEIVDEYNAKYCQVTTGGRSYVVRDGLDTLDRKTLEFFTIKGFREHTLSAEQIITGYYANGMPKTESAAEIWLKSPRKRFYEYGVTFYPSVEKEINGKLNSYFGFGVAVDDNYDIVSELAVSDYLEFVKTVICAGNSDHYEYVIKWLAHAVQKPWEKPEVALFLKGGQGTGKGTFMRPFRQIFGSHYAHPQTSEHVVGRFNSLLECKILVFADEFFSGKKAVSDKLKGMITERTTTIERKGIDAIEVPSYTRLVFASNHDSAISFEKDERRYMYLSVSDKNKQSAEYFSKINDAIDLAGFAGSLLAYLSSIDISNFNPREVPKTQALTNAKLEALSSIEAWVMSCLRRESFSSVVPSVEMARQTRYSIDNLSSSFNDWLRAENRKEFGDKAKKIGRMMVMMGAVKFDRGSGVSCGRRGYELKSFDDMRARFIEHMGFEVDWDL